MIDDSSQIIREHIQQNQMQQLMDFIQDKNINILSLDCGKKQSILHIAIQNNDFQFLCFLEQFCNDNYKESEIRKLVNQFNLQIFTALHIASYNGSLECVKILLKMGADPSLRSGSGLLPIHAAAQGDQPYMVWYWIQTGISVNALDDQGNACLHWAAYQNCELTVSYLISFNCDINQQNSQMQTALHIGALYNQSRIVKKLLIKGADRNIQDIDGLLPIQLTESQNIKRMLEDKMDLALFYNLKQPYHPIKRNRKSLIVYYFVIISSQICIWQLIENGSTNKICHIILCILLLTFTLLSQLIDAGVIKKQIIIKEAINEMIDPIHICPDCWVIKPMRSKHCEFCQQCVIVYDHHCPWIDNCVGASNFLYFYIFLTLLTIVQIYSFGILILYFVTINSIKFFNALLLLYPLLCIAIFFFPIFALWCYQTNNLLYGVTTYERIMGKKLNNKASLLFAQENIQDSQIAEEEVKKSFLNCYNQCFRNKKIFKKYL